MVFLFWSVLVLFEGSLILLLTAWLNEHPVIVLLEFLLFLTDDNHMNLMGFLQGEVNQWVSKSPKEK